MVVPEAGPEESDRHPARRYVLAGLADLDREGSWACDSVRTAMRSRRYARCPELEQGHEGSRDHVLRRSEESRLRAAHQFQRHRQRERRGVPSRDAADGGRLPVERARRSLAGSAPALAVRRESRARRRRRCRAAPTSSTSTSRSRKACRVSSAAASASPRPTASRSAATSCTRTSWAPATGVALRSAGRQVPEGLRRELSRTLIAPSTVCRASCR